MYILPEHLRSQLREPLGKIVTDAELENELNKEVECIVVGDESAISLYKNQYKIKLAIVDFKTQRRKDDELKAEVMKIGKKVIKVTNPKGTITDELWDAITRGLKDPVPVRIDVTGEEDLAFIPCMLLAPDDAVIVYGYPNRGLVLAWVTPTNRQTVKDALELMIKEV
ncbi:MAG: DUF359 domain-containing protein [Thermoplasmata archaeon]|nr:DUF359 domain-containing protein [Thermoplasmata archaeon]